MSTTINDILNTGYPIGGLGNLGLGISPYMSYDNYLMTNSLGMGIDSIFTMNPMMYSGSTTGMNPMMYGGLYNPLFMGQMQGELEKYQLDHTGVMHNKMLGYEVQADLETDRAQISKMLKNTSVLRGVENLRRKVVEGDQDGICNEYDKLKNQIYTTYKEELAARGTEENYPVAAGKIIDNLYATATGGNLHDDIIKYGEGATANGFQQGLKPGHHTRYVDETLKHCYGIDIDDKEAKDRAQEIARYGGEIARYGKVGLVGAGICGGAGLTAAGLIKAIAPEGSPTGVDATKLSEKIGNLAKKIKWSNWLKVGGVLGFIGAIGVYIWGFKNA